MLLQNLLRGGEKSDVLFWMHVFPWNSPLNKAKFYRPINIHFVGHLWFRFLLKSMPNPFYFLLYIWFTSSDTTKFPVRFSSVSFFPSIFQYPVLFPRCGLGKVLKWIKSERTIDSGKNNAMNEKKAKVWILYCVIHIRLCVHCWFPFLCSHFWLWSCWLFGIRGADTTQTNHSGKTPTTIHTQKLRTVAERHHFIMQML